MLVTVSCCITLSSITGECICNTTVGYISAAHTKDVDEYQLWIICSPLVASATSWPLSFIPPSAFFFSTLLYSYSSSHRSWMLPATAAATAATIKSTFSSISSLLIYMCVYFFFFNSFLNDAVALAVQYKKKLFLSLSPPSFDSHLPAARVHQPSIDSASASLLSLSLFLLYFFSSCCCF